MCAFRLTRAGRHLGLAPRTRDRPAENPVRCLQGMIAMRAGQSVAESRAPPGPRCIGTYDGWDDHVCRSRPESVRLETASNLPASRLGRRNRFFKRTDMDLNSLVLKIGPRSADGRS